jgi:hypothetical protein
MYGVRVDAHSNAVELSKVSQYLTALRLDYSVQPEVEHDCHFITDLLFKTCCAFIFKLLGIYGPS